VVILVVENNHPVAGLAKQGIDDRYRAMALIGGTYDEEGYRDWVAHSFEADRNLPLADLAKAASQGGWTTLLQLA
jgi:hypothetical protein